ncbi:MAG TPA: T9SS type A sorting domain-containing protein, partial [Prevotella sp.]
NPGGPKYNYFGFLKYHQGTLYTSGGGWNVSKDLNREGCVQTLKNGEWTVYQDDIATLTGHDYLNLEALDVDPNNPQRVFAAGRTGVYEFDNGRFVREFNNHNSPLRGAATVDPHNKNYTIVLGIRFDESSNLWLFNALSATTSLFEYTPDGNWNSFHKTAFMNAGRSFDNLTNPIFDSRGLLWYVNDYFGYPVLVSYNRTSDAATVYNNFINEDGIKIEITQARTVTEDKNNNIWMGTNLGPLVLEASELANGGTTFQQYKVPRNDGTNYADYLLSGVDITAIAVDGANRKWFGTNGNGVYLIDADNTTELQHFTTDNSKLLSNTIESIAINGETGEVFFGTDKGLCSYMSDATNSSEDGENNEAYAYPNPVRPDYSGLITVVGLSFNADVKIVTANGVLVAQGKSNGGTFVWDGTDLKGKRVASGVYMVQTATQEGTKGTVCKIAIVR